LHSGEHRAQKQRARRFVRSVEQPPNFWRRQNLHLLLFAPRPLRILRRIRVEVAPLDRIEADAYTPPAPNAAPMCLPNPFTVNLVENLTKQGLAVDQILSLHGRMVPIAHPEPPSKLA
jgi:hypothetical protein